MMLVYFIILTFGTNAIMGDIPTMKQNNSNLCKQIILKIPSFVESYEIIYHELDHNCYVTLLVPYKKYSINATDTKNLVGTSGNNFSEVFDGICHELGGTWISYLNTSKVTLSNSSLNNNGIGIGNESMKIVCKYIGQIIDMESEHSLDQDNDMNCDFTIYLPTRNPVLRFNLANHLNSMRHFKNGNRSKVFQCQITVSKSPSQNQLIRNSRIFLDITQFNLPDESPSSPEHIPEGKCTSNYATVFESRNSERNGKVGSNRSPLTIKSSAAFKFLYVDSDVYYVSKSPKARSVGLPYYVSPQTPNNANDTVTKICGDWTDTLKLLQFETKKDALKLVLNLNYEVALRILQSNNEYQVNGNQVPPDIGIQFTAFVGMDKQSPSKVSSPSKPTNKPINQVTGVFFKWASPADRTAFYPKDVGRDYVALQMPNEHYWIELNFEAIDIEYQERCLYDFIGVSTLPFGSNFEESTQTPFFMFCGLHAKYSVKLEENRFDINPCSLANSKLESGNLGIMGNFNSKQIAIPMHYRMCIFGDDKFRLLFLNEAQGNAAAAAAAYPKGNIYLTSWNPLKFVVSSPNTTITFASDESINRGRGVTFRWQGIDMETCNLTITLMPPLLETDPKLLTNNASTGNSVGSFARLDLPYINCGVSFKMIQNKNSSERQSSKGFILITLEGIVGNFGKLNLNHGNEGDEDDSRSKAKVQFRTCFEEFIEINFGFVDGNKLHNVILCPNDLRTLGMTRSNNNAQFLSYGLADTIDVTYHKNKLENIITSYNVRYELVYKYERTRELEIDGYSTPASPNYIISVNYPLNIPPGINETILLKVNQKANIVVYMEGSYQIVTNTSGCTSVEIIVEDPFNTSNTLNLCPKSLKETFDNKTNEGEGIELFYLLTSHLHVLRIFIKTANANITNSTYKDELAVTPPYIIKWKINKDYEFDSKLDLIPWLNVGNENFCTNNGTYTSNICACRAPFLGRYCLDSPCDTQNCNHGVCEITDLNVKCLCDSFHIGPDCQFEICPPEYTKVGISSPDQLFCKGNGRCYLSPDDGSRKCLCYYGYSGNDCNDDGPGLRLLTPSQKFFQEPFWMGIFLVIFVLLVLGLIMLLQRKWAGEYKFVLFEDCLSNKKQRRKQNKYYNSDYQNEISEPPYDYGVTSSGSSGQFATLDTIITNIHNKATNALSTRRKSTKFLLPKDESVFGFRRHTLIGTNCDSPANDDNDVEIISKSMGDHMSRKNQRKKSFFLTIGDTLRRKSSPRSLSPKLLPGDGDGDIKTKKGRRNSIDEESAMGSTSFVNLVSPLGLGKKNGTITTTNNNVHEYPVLHEANSRKHHSIARASEQINPFGHATDHTEMPGNSGKLYKEDNHFRMDQGGMFNLNSLNNQKYKIPIDSLIIENEKKNLPIHHREPLSKVMHRNVSKNLLTAYSAPFSLRSESPAITSDEDDNNFPRAHIANNEVANTDKSRPNIFGARPMLWNRNFPPPFIKALRSPLDFEPFNPVISHVINLAELSRKRETFLPRRSSNNVYYAQRTKRHRNTVDQIRDLEKENLEELAVWSDVESCLEMEMGKARSRNSLHASNNLNDLQLMVGGSKPSSIQSI